jgi:hypothetical protein
MVRNEWKGMLIIEHDECDGSQSCGMHWSTVRNSDRQWSGWEQWREAVPHIPGAICLCDHSVYTYLKCKWYLGREIMLVLGFYGNETGSPTIIRLGLWEDQVLNWHDVTFCDCWLVGGAGFIVGHSVGIKRWYQAQMGSRPVINLAGLRTMIYISIFSDTSIYILQDK